MSANSAGPIVTVIWSNTQHAAVQQTRNTAFATKAGVMVAPTILFVTCYNRLPREELARLWLTQVSRRVVRGIFRATHIYPCSQDYPQGGDFDCAESSDFVPSTQSSPIFELGCSGLDYMVTTSITGKAALSRWTNGVHPAAVLEIV